MGKATIQSGGTDGLYTVVRDYDADKLAALVAAEVKKIDAHGQQVTKIEQEIASLQAALVVASDSVQAAIDALIAAMGTGVDVDQAAKAYAATQAKFTELTLKISAETLKKRTIEAVIKAAEKRKAALDASALPANQSAWCADFAESASGPVATIEIPGEPGSIIIRPQSPPSGGADYSEIRDGILTPRLWQSPEQAFFNAAILPGWQRHQPTYRAGTITGINTSADTCSLTLVEARSSAQDLDVNHESSLTAVPITYMTCNSAAFEVGDLVVVEFAGQSWETPRVIGFVANPRPCDVVGGYFVLPADDAAPSGWPIDGVADALIALRESGNDPIVTKNRIARASGVAWYGTGGTVITYDHGGSTRYGSRSPSGTGGAGGAAELFLYGTRIPAPGPVVGVGISGDLIIVATQPANNAVAFHSAPSPHEELKSGLVGGLPVAEMVLTWTILSTVPGPNDREFRQGWVFSPSGHEAQTVVRSSDATLPTIRVKAFITITIDPDTDEPEAQITHQPFEYPHPSMRLATGGGPVVAESIEFLGYDIGEWVTGRSDADALAYIESINIFGSSDISVMSETTPGLDGQYTDTLSGPLYGMTPVPWPTRVTKTYFLGHSNPPDTPFTDANEQSSVTQVRKAWCRFRKRLPTSQSHISVSGRELIAVDYDEAGAERFVELMAEPGFETVSFEYVTYIDEVVAARKVSHIRSGGLASFHYKTGGQQEPPPPGGVMPPSGTWFGFDPGLAVADERSEDTIEVTGSIRLQVKAGATVLGGFSVDSQSELSQVILDSEITPAYPPAQGEQMGINIGPAVLQPSVMTPFVINGDRVVDLDGKHGVVLSERRTYTAELAHATPPPGESAKLTATGRLNRAQQASRFGSVIAATPPGKDETWHPNFNGTIEMNFSTFWTTAMQSAISDTIAGFVGGSSIFTTTVGASTPKLFFQTVGGELGYISARNPTSMVVTLRSFEDTPTRTSYAIMNNAPYELVAALTPPSATNFRVNPIRLV